MSTRPNTARQPAPEAPMVNTGAASRAAKHVTVACKVPTGLILQLCVEDTYDEETPTGSRQRKRWTPAGKRIVLQGPAYPVGGPMKGFVKPPPILVGGYALTSGVDADFWDQWVEQHRMNPLVTNKQVFAYARHEDVSAMAREHAAVRSGYEPLNPDGNDSRMPKPDPDGYGGITTADEKARPVARAEG